MTATSAPTRDAQPVLARGRVTLRPLAEVGPAAWKRIHAHFRDPEIAFLNGTPPSRMPLWLMRRVLRSDARRPDRRTYGVFDEHDEYVGTVELYDLRGAEATLGIIIGERSHWGRGYGPEAIEALMAHAFGDLGLERVRLHTFADNPRAQAAFKKVGFVELRRVPARNDRIDVQMALERDAWAARHRLGGAP
jgi:RimJ/RimL family protein N-acetyltransferase